MRKFVWMLMPIVGLLVVSADAQQADAPEPLDIPLPALAQLELKTDTVILAPLERGEFEQAIELARTRIDRAAERGLREELPHLYFQLAHAQRRGGEPFDAALSFLRVVIHFPNHPLVPPAMERAGHALYEANLPEPAMKLWQRARDRVEDAASNARLSETLRAAKRNTAP